MSQPLATVAVLYVAGLLLASAIPLPLYAAFGAAFGLVFLAAVAGRCRPYLLALLLIASGAANLAGRMAILSPHDLRLILKSSPALVTVRGTLCATPTERIFVRDQAETSYSLAQLTVAAVQFRDRFEPASGTIVVSTPGVLSSDFFTGRTVEVAGVIALPRSAIADGLFDYQAYLRWQRVYYQLRVEATNDWRLSESAGARHRAPIADRFLNWAQAALARGLPAQDQPIKLLWAMTLGWKTALTESVSEPFVQTGTMHIFAISGLHIALIAGILVSVLRVLRVPREACGVLVVPLLWFYTGVTGWQSSAIRSTIMMTVVIMGWALRRPGNLLNSLAASGLIILLWQPEQLFQASFQLSFFVVLSLGILLPAFEKICRGFLATDPFLPPELRPAWRRYLDVPLRFLTLSLATSLAAWVGSFPLIAYYFHVVTPVSLFANMLIVPLSSLALMCNLASLLSAGWLPAVAELLNHSGWLWMKLMLDSSLWLAHLPGAFFFVRAPSPLEFALFYLGSFCVLSGWIFAPDRLRWAGPALGLLLVGWGWQLEAASRKQQLTVLALGGGDAIWFGNARSQDELLIDCGNTFAADRIVQPFLQAQGRNRLASLLLTHGDARHSGGASNILQTFRPPSVYTSPLGFRSPQYRRLARELDPGRRRPVSRGDLVGRWEVLHPAQDDAFPLADDKTIVLRARLHGLSVLLCSDLGRAGQRKLLAREADLRADVVVAGIPTNGEPLTDAFLDAVQPQVAILSTGLTPLEQAKPALRQRLGQKPFRVCYTADLGSITLSARPNRAELRLMDGTRVPLRPSRF